MFVTLFTMIYTIVKKIYSYLYPLPLQTFVYDKEKKRVMIRGYMGWSVQRIETPHFMVDGDFTIKINHKTIPCIKNWDIDDFRVDKQYFLSTKDIFTTEETTIIVTDNIMDETKVFEYDKNVHIDLVNLIKINF